MNHHEVVSHLGQIVSLCTAVKMRVLQLKLLMNVAGIDREDPDILDEEAQLLEIEQVANIFNLYCDLDALAVQCRTMNSVCG
jgi:hypothetical protein